ncbi:MAG TPA: thiamine phosphate synthase, partial [Acidimicrobiales bacterium]|nr:thiamine phosphate synthase [Acidimicrobiales bacterium]
PAGVRRVAAAVAVPVIAIGGVDAQRTRTLMEAGAWGVAVCGAAFATSDPRGAIESLVTVVGNGKVPQP